jgi:transcriptional regulator with XRE-family HTH domain
MTTRFISYLRPLRRRWGLTQRELAFLIGGQSGAAISRLEQLKRTPSLAALIACEVLFGVGHTEIFPDSYTQVRQAVMARANELYEALQGNPSRATRAKLDFLESVLARGGDAELSPADL